MEKRKECQALFECPHSNKSCIGSKWRKSTRLSVVLKHLQACKTELPYVLHSFIHCFPLLTSDIMHLYNPPPTFFISKPDEHLHFKKKVIHLVHIQAKTSDFEECLALLCVPTWGRRVLCQVDVRQHDVPVIVLQLLAVKSHFCQLLRLHCVHQSGTIDLDW